MAKTNYNAESAWNYLGTNLFDGRGVYDYSTQPKYKQIFQAIEQEPLRKQNSFEDNDALSISVGRYNNTRALLNNLTNNELMQQMLSGSVFNLSTPFTNYPQTVVQNALAGKYQSLI